MRVAIFIDGITLFHGLKEMKNQNINFVLLKNWLKEKNNLTSSCYFNATKTIETKKSFFSHVHKSGFNIYIRKPKKNAFIKKININEMIVEFVLEAIIQKQKYDKIIIVSGKHDFLPLCEKLFLLNKKVEIVGFKKNINKVYNKYKQRYLDDFLKKQGEYFVDGKNGEFIFE